MEKLNSFRRLNQKWSNGENSSELLRAQAHIWNHIFSFINSMSLNSAIQLGIPDIINKHGRPMTISELTSALQINPSKSHSIYRLMRILTHSGFFIMKKLNIFDDDAEGYALTDASNLLLKDHPFSVAPFVNAMLDPVMTKPWRYLSTWFLNDDATSFETAHGSMLWDYTNQQPGFDHVFNDAMASDARLVASVIVDEFKGVFEGLDSLVDVGGGTGTMAKAIADAFPHVECIVLDLPHVVANLQGSNNFNYIGGDMFEAIPPADAVLLKWIMHDWNDEECVAILKKAKEAITSKDKKGKVIIIDINMMEEKQKGEEETMEAQLFWDMLMMTNLTGKERNEKEWAKLFTDAGFSDYKITPIPGLRSLIELYP